MVHSYEPLVRNPGNLTERRGLILPVPLKKLGAHTGAVEPDSCKIRRKNHQKTDRTPAFRVREPNGIQRPYWAPLKTVRAPLKEFGVPLKG